MKSNSQQVFKCYWEVQEKEIRLLGPCQKEIIQQFSEMVSFLHGSMSAGCAGLKISFTSVSWWWPLAMASCVRKGRFVFERYLWNGYTACLKEKGQDGSLLWIAHWLFQWGPVLPAFDPCKPGRARVEFTSFWVSYVSVVGTGKASSLPVGERKWCRRHAVWGSWDSHHPHS